MYTILKLLIVREELQKKGFKIFTPSEFGMVFNLPGYKAKYYLERWTGEDMLVRLKKGLYSYKLDLPSEKEIANRLYRPSYLSFEYALAYYNILPEMTYVITSATTKTTRNIASGSKTYLYFKIKKEAFIGYSLTKVGEATFLIAEPEKALVDYLYFVVLGKKPFNERLHLSHLNKEKILEYAKLYNRPKLTNLILGLI